ncbi:DUF6389 family protein [Marinoscillum furvescens]|uniref:Uncharacterized protein n=1 Tax=Marinoscillum furvescens DSM 4134 TaxID=1122208 RepID=A0A3D9KXY6_MARFU|nr:DUF6389 family protein [Marinoscillum furvescens]RED92854.1 hypothetical protein C7460_12873 [Marinoscillum furvescens DSM 4134]
MEETEYKSKLRRVLDENSKVALTNLNATLRTIPKAAKSIELMIFPDQDGEGTFSVSVSLTGPDLYILNSSINETSELISVIHTPNGLQPKVPLMDPFDSEFEVKDALCDVLGEWLETIWINSDKHLTNLAVTIVADEGYGQSLPIKLN